MKIALVNLCKEEDFSKHKTYQDCISFLEEEGIDYLDFCSGHDDLDILVKKFNDSLSSEADIVWFVCGGWTCLKVLDKIDWDKVVASKKKFYGLSDFTHFSSKATSLGLNCYYGQGLAHIKQFFPTTESRQFIVDFLKTGVPNYSLAEPLSPNTKALDISKVKIVGGHMLIFTFMQNQLSVNLKDKYLFLEYHHSANGLSLQEIEYYLNQVLFTIKDNLPQGFILGRHMLKDFEGEEIKVEEINNFLTSKLLKYNLPVYYMNHFHNIVPLTN